MPAEKPSEPQEATASESESEGSDFLARFARRGPQGGYAAAASEEEAGREKAHKV